MLIDDQVLPAAGHLTGPGAIELLATTVAAAGGELATARAVHVRYRPGADLVVRYDASVRWAGNPAVSETLVAATTTGGVLPGTVPLVAETDDGPLEVGVWRWPFDPIVTGLTAAVTPALVGDLIGVGAERVRLEVVAYRPTERAVVRASVVDGRSYFLKVVEPSRSADLVERHRQLREAGLPVPVVASHLADAGIVVLEALTDPTLRDVIKSDERRWPPAEEYLHLTGALATARLAGAVPTSSRVSDALGHARMIGEVLPDQRHRLDALCDEFTGALARVAERTGPTIHGDLYEAQLMVDGTRISGLLDVDDAGPGDPLDDLATVLAHLHYRAAAHPGREHVERYARSLTRAFEAHSVAAGHPEGELALVTAAAMVGLATGPFRIQQHGWRHAVRRHVDRARTFADRARAGSSTPAGSRS